MIELFSDSLHRNPAPVLDQNIKKRVLRLPHVTCLTPIYRNLIIHLKRAIIIKAREKIYNTFLLQAALVTRESRVLWINGGH